MSQFIRNTHNSSFIAYAAAPSRKPQNVRVGDADQQVKVFPDVFINEFMSVKIASIEESDKSVNVKFDASSIELDSGKKMKFNFSGNTQPNSPIHQLAVEAHGTDRPVYLALETRRRYRNSDGQTIPYTTPISVLRGCENGPQSKGDAQTTRANCSKVIAVMGFADQPATVVSNEASSNPLEWGQVRDNQDGDLPPTGYALVSMPDGSATGCVIKTDDASAGAVAGGAVTKQLNQLTHMVSKMANTGTSGGAGTRPWQERQQDGSVNPGSYAVTQTRHTMALASQLIAAAGGTDFGTDQRHNNVVSLTRVLLWAADKVQYSATGGVDRMSKAHCEAGAWVKQVIDTELPYTDQHAADENMAKQWANAVVGTATRYYQDALSIVAGHLQASSGVATPNGNTAQQNQPQQRQKPERLMLADDAEARAQWDKFVTDINMAAHVDRLNPVLTKTFGTHMSTHIPADQFRAALTKWMDNPGKFVGWAKQCFTDQAAPAA